MKFAQGNKLLPKINGILYCDAANSNIIAGKNDVKKILRKILTRTPPRGYFLILPNILGLQIIRVLYHRAAFLIRCLIFRNASSLNDYTDTLQQDGVVVIPNFLSDEDFEKVKSEYYRKIEEHQNSEPSVVGPKLITIPCSTATDIIHQDIYNLLGDNDLSKKIIKYAAAKPMNTFPKVSLHYYFAEEEDIGIREEALTDTLHYDVPLNSFRSFYYVEPCTRENAAFEYAKGTHKLNWARLKLEYFDSIKQARMRKGNDERVKPIDQDLLDDINANPQPIEGPGNSLVIFNTMGMHRRGLFSKAGQRHAILIDYRFMDTLLNLLPKNKT